MAGKKARQRRLARERLERRDTRRAQQARQARKWTIAVLAAVVVAAVGVGIPALLGAYSGGSSPAVASGTKPSASSSPSASASSSPSASAAAAREPSHHCTYTANPPAARKVSFPPSRPDYRARYTAVIKTNRGTIRIELRNRKATCTVNSFVSLSRQSYFNGTHCHRLTTSGIYVLQCGDPTGTGTGGPGYEFASENLAGAGYTGGTVAMANTGQPDSNGSQFFLVYKNSSLPPDYTPFGTITSGLNIIRKVAKAGSDNSSGPGDGHPREKVDIDSVTITQT